MLTRSWGWFRGSVIMPASQFTSQVSACLLQMSVRSSYFFCACVQSERQSWRGVVRNNPQKWEKAAISAISASDFSAGHGALPVASFGRITFSFICSFPKYKTNWLMKEQFIPEGRHPVRYVDNFPELMCVLVTLAGSLLIWKTEVK